MNQINVNVKATSKSAEFYSLIEVKEILDRLQEEIDPGGQSPVIELPKDTTEFTAKPGKIYLVEPTPFLSIEFESPQETVGKFEYYVVFSGKEDFTLTLSAPKQDIYLKEGTRVMDGGNILHATSFGTDVLLAVDIQNFGYGDYVENPNDAGDSGSSDESDTSGDDSGSGSSGSNVQPPIDDIPLF